jgi:hypothetical protein
MLRSVARGEVAEEDDSLAHDCNNYGYHEYAPMFSWDLHVPVSAIRYD